MKYGAATLVVLAMLVACVSADMYMHNPRGSNNRLNGNGNNRANNNRLFDTQNNAKGGYCFGPQMSFYEGSLTTVEWTNQHGCGAASGTHCEIIIQYACSNADDEGELLMRDGTSTDDTPDDANNYLNMDGETGLYTYGMHENYYYYQECKARGRNANLFTADRNLNGDRAIYTRQNNNGNRNGFECPEERDHYPYWHPSIWRDVAVMTDELDRCDYYKEQSQNVMSKYRCTDPANPEDITDNDKFYQTDEQACTLNGGVWTETKAWGIDEPDCVMAPWSRQNHLGNGAMLGGNNNVYNMTMPKADDLGCVEGTGCSCVLRLRYNVSTADYDGWNTDARYNDDLSPVKNDPLVPILGFNLSLAINTNQFARTFQDRTHTFNVIPRPDGVSSSAHIFNLNVRGKRGNIVQTYPATEYDFAPSALTVRQNDYVHFQWTGCDNNPAGNDGEGTSTTDRSNIVQLENKVVSYPWYWDDIPEDKRMIEDWDTAMYYAYAGQDIENCPSYQDLINENGDNDDAIEEDVDNCFKLNAADRYFNGGLLSANKTGTFYYMSSRNNNYTNRAQKATLTVVPLLPSWAIVLLAAAGGVFVLAAATFGGMLYSRSHPHSKMAEIFDRF